LAKPPPRPRLIDRFLVAAYDAGLEPLLCLTKADLASPANLLAAYEPLGVRAIALRRPFHSRVDTLRAKALRRPVRSQLDTLRGLLAGRISVLVGHSGVGKSTLVNALLPGADRAVGMVSPVTGRGRHTSSSAVALPLEPGPGGEPGGASSHALAVAAGGWIIDTPGLRSFGLGHVAPDRVVSAFGEFADAIAQCPPGCTHLAPDCALDNWVAEHGGRSAAARLDSLRRLLRSREGTDRENQAESAE
ncbi:MAG: ribosome small subunit-dependent GTPase A, partial [Actinobacteria bacterium]|nr:ribosome small subunit-dependent GTPase A [Actinomycetota bacterium]